MLVCGLLLLLGIAKYLECVVVYMRVCFVLLGCRIVFNSVVLFLDFVRCVVCYYIAVFVCIVATCY